MALMNAALARIADIVITATPVVICAAFTTNGAMKPHHG
jgi:hypothetical protein